MRRCVPWVRNRSRLRRRLGASAIGGMAAAAFVVLVSDPAASQTPSTESAAQATICCSRRCKAIRRRHRAFGKPGQKRPSRRRATADQHIRAEPHRRNARATAAPAASAPPIPASIRSMSRAPNARSAAPPPDAPHHRAAAAGDDIHAGADLQPGRSLRRRLRSRSKCRRRRSIRCAPQCGSAQLCRRHRRRCRRSSSTIRRPRFIRSRPPIAPAAVWRRRGRNFTPTRSAAICRTMSPTRHRRTCNRPIPSRSGSGRSACCRSWPSPIRTRRSASAPARSYCFPRSTFRVPPAPIPNTCPAVRPPLTSSPRRN